MCACDCNQPFIAIVLRFINLNDTARELAYFVDLGSSLSDDRSDHIVGDENLLREGLSRQHSHRVGRLPSGLGRRSGSLARLMRPGTRISTGLLGVGVVNRCLGGRSGSLSVEIGHSVRVGRSALGCIVMTLERLGVAVGPMEGLGLVRDDLHSAGNGAGRPAGASCVGRSRGSSVTLGELLDEGVGDVVSRDMDGIGDTSHNQRSLGRERQCRTGSVEPCTGRVLNLAYPGTSLSND